MTGNCARGINCKDDEGDFFSLGEFNLNSWGSLDCQSNLTLARTSAPLQS